MPGIDTGWHRSVYGDDLLWVIGAWDNPVVVGNGSAVLKWRKRLGEFVGTIEVVIGTTTVIPGVPAGGNPGMYFEFPNQGFVFANSDQVPRIGFQPLMTTNTEIGSEWPHSNGVSICDDTVTLEGETRPGCTGWLDGPPAGGAGQLTAGFPFPFAPGDQIRMNVWLPVLDN
jgi:hypothetical protein